MSKFKKSSKLCGKLAGLFLFLFFLFLGMGIMESPRRTGVEPSQLTAFLTLLLVLSGACFVIFLIGIFMPGEEEPVAAKEKPTLRRLPRRAALWSILIGVGQLYNGQLPKAIVMWALCWLVFFLAAELPLSESLRSIFVPVGIISVWLYAAFDAYATAKKINKAAQ